MATGDLKNNLRQMQSKLKLINYPKDIDMKGISKGLAQEFLPLLHYILLEYSRPLAEYIINNDMELYGKKDDKFMAAVYKVFRDIFHYKPSITRHQFFSYGFAEHKMIMVMDLIRMVRDKHKELCKTMPAGHKKLFGSLSRLRRTSSKEQVGTTQSASNQDQPTTPDLLAASASDVSAAFPTTTDSEPKATEADTGYHTAETSPTCKTLEEQQEDAMQTSLSVNELRAKFENSGLQKQESSDSKLNDTELEEHPVIQALVKQIVHLEEQLTKIAEDLETRMKGVEGRLSTVQSHMVLMENRVSLLESKVLTEPVEGKPIRPTLAQGIPQDAPLAFLKPTKRRPEDVPLPESPGIPPTPSQTPSSAQTPPAALSISAVVPDQDLFTAPQANLGTDSSPMSIKHEKPVRDTSPQHKPQPTVTYSSAQVPISVVVPMTHVGGSETSDPDVVTIHGATSPSPMDAAWIRPSTSTPNGASSPEGRDAIGQEDEGLGDVVDDDDDDLGEHIAREYRGEMSAATGQAAEAAEAGVDVEETSEIPVRDIGQSKASEELQDQEENIYSHLQRVQNMLADTQHMLSMETSLTSASPKKE